MALTDEQKQTAQALLDRRPPVLPGTRAIIDDVSREAWHADVAAEARARNVQPNDAKEFFDLAGVAD